MTGSASDETDSGQQGHALRGGPMHAQIASGEPHKPSESGQA